jgi:hypothetical protein
MRLRTRRVQSLRTAHRAKLSLRSALRAEPLRFAMQRICAQGGAESVLVLSG